MIEGIRMRAAIIVAAAGLAATALTASPAQAGLDPHLYGTKATNGFCADAQQIIAATPLVADNVLSPDADHFVNETDAAPWDGNEDAPLATAQLNSVEETEAGDLLTVISCKMKDAESIQTYFGEDQAEQDLERQCADVHAVVVDAVFDSLHHRATPVYTRGQVRLADDQLTWGGPDWTSELPPTVAFTDGDDLVLRSKAMVVPRAASVAPFPGPSKAGVHYCHLIAPIHLRALLLGELTAPDLPATPPLPYLFLDNAGL